MKDQAEQLFLENQLCFPLYAASRMTTKIYAPYLKVIDLTYPQYLVMMVLWQHKSQSVNQIGERLMLESNTLTPLLKRLEQKGLLKRQRSTSDERSVEVSISAKGEKLKEQAKSIPEKIIDSFQDSALTEVELKQFQETLFKLSSTLNKKVKDL